jgi:GTP cyclohydrolase II
MDHTPTQAALGERVPGRFRALHRVLGELRRGAPVRLDGPEPLLVLAAESSDDASVDAFLRLAETPPVLLLAGCRGARLVGGIPRAVRAARLDAARPGPDLLWALADPTRPETGAALTDAPVPPSAEAAIALCKLARLLPAALAAPPAPGDEPDVLAVPAADVLAYPAEAGLREVARARLPLEDVGEVELLAFRPVDGGTEHLAIVLGDPTGSPPPLVRVHSECFTGDLLGSLRCDCGPQLRRALARMAEEGRGVLLYLAQEGRGIGLVNKLRAYALQDRGLDTLDANRALGWDADERDFGVAAAMLRALGVETIRLLTNNPDKIDALAAHGITVAERVAHRIAPNGVDDAYLRTKHTRFRHLL